MELHGLCAPIVRQLIDSIRIMNTSIRYSCPEQEYANMCNFMIMLIILSVSYFHDSSQEEYHHYQYE
jgi:hypothetical protein